MAVLSLVRYLLVACFLAMGFRQEVVGVVLVVASIAIIVAAEFVVDPVALGALYAADFVIALVLIYDYVRRVQRGGLRYFLRTFYEVVAYVPAVVFWVVNLPHAAALLRTLRILRIFALGVRLMREIQALSVKLLGASFSILFLTVVLGGLGFYMAERDVQEVGLVDSIYWALVTATTLGYGDVVPRTAVGRAVAGVVVLMGVVAVSLFTSSVVSVAVAPRERRGFREELEELLGKYENSPDRELVEKVRRVVQESSK